MYYFFSTNIEHFSEMMTLSLNSYCSFFSPQLITIYNVLPQHICPWSNRCYRVEVCLGEPNSQDGVLLPQSLSSCHSSVVLGANLTTKPKLQQTNNQSYPGNCKLQCIGSTLLHADKHGYSADNDGEGHSPKIE